MCTTSSKKEDVSDPYLGLTAPPYLEGPFCSSVWLGLGQRHHPDLISNSNDEIRVLDEHGPPPST